MISEQQQCPNRAAVLREAADAVVRYTGNDLDSTAKMLRRMADEAQQQCPNREPLDEAQCSKQAGHEGPHSDRPGRIWYPLPADEAQQPEPTTSRDAEIERLHTENTRMRHELEVMYGGAFDNLPSAHGADPAEARPQ